MSTDLMEIAIPVSERGGPVKGCIQENVDEFLE